MAYSDVVQFGVSKDLVRRLGYKTMCEVGKDMVLVQRPQPGNEIPQIVRNRDPGVLINGLRDINVVGIIFDREELTKKVVEKAGELKKTIFIPVGELTLVNVAERGPKVGRMRKIIFSAHKLGARVQLVTLASSEIELLSTGQLKAVGRFLLKDKEGGNLFGKIL